MNNIEINIYTSDIEFKKIFLNLDNSTITFNKKSIKLSKSDLTAVTNRILSIIKQWENINFIGVSEYTKVVVKINLSEDKKEYEFIGKVPSNMYKIYDVIECVKEKTI